MYDPERVTYFAETDYRNQRTKFGIKAIDRTKHIYVIGKTGMGKSTLLENMAIQDIQNGEGFAYIDPHGATAEKLLSFIPEHRIKDVIYFAPFDTEFPISFNIMEDVGPDKRHLVASGLMSAFKKIWADAWSARMEHILNNTILALLEYPDATLLSVNKMLTDKEYRKKVVDNVQDFSVKSFWVDEFAKYTDRFAAEATPAIQNKVGQFTSNPLIRNIIGQPKSSFDIRDIMDNKKILIMNLSKGLVGEQNAKLLGSMLVTKIYLGAMSRADLSEQDIKTKPNFYFYVDEFQTFVNETFAEILSEARKYKLNLTIAHQYIEQMIDQVRSAVFGNVGTTIAFRVGPFDAEVLENIFMPRFTKTDLVNLGFAQIYLTMSIDGVGCPPFSAKTLPPISTEHESFRAQILESSRTQFAKPRKEVEEKIVQTLGESEKKEMPAGPSGKDFVKKDFSRDRKPIKKISGRENLDNSLGTLLKKLDTPSEKKPDLKKEKKSSFVLKSDLAKTFEEKPVVEKKEERSMSLGSLKQRPPEVKSPGIKFDPSKDASQEKRNALKEALSKVSMTSKVFEDKKGEKKEEIVDTPKKTIQDFNKSISSIKEDEPAPTIEKPKETKIEPEKNKISPEELLKIFDE